MRKFRLQVMPVVLSMTHEVMMGVMHASLTLCACGDGIGAVRDELIRR